LSEIVPLYKKLAADDQDSVRLLTIPDLIAIAEQLPPQEVKSELNVQLTAAYTDKSWRVRYMLADHFVEVSDSRLFRIR
jgi:serine/threonine-protein phosphatase 2A regulatory subunit A